MSLVNKTNVRVNGLSNSDSEVRTTRPLSPKQVAQYHEEGFVIIPSFFDLKEIEPLRKACEKDSTIQGAQTDFIDSQGNSNQIAHWAKLGDSLLGTIPRLARMVDAVELLLGGQECYHWYSKIVRKKAWSKGTIEWHQDYGTWYYDNFLFPDLVSVLIAVDRHTKENGCVKVIKKSHLLHRIDHAVRGEALYADPVRTEQILQKLEVFDVEMNPGDTMLMHGNTMHCSEENKTDQARTNFICTYNARSNEPVNLKNDYAQYQPIKKLPDCWILDDKYNSVFDTQEFLAPEVREIIIRGKKGCN